jgi:hypothetical protein
MEGGAMTPKTVFIFLGKLLICALTFVVGMILGGILAGLAGLPAPTLPPEMDANTTMLIMFASSPLLVLALYFLGRELVGGWFVRAGVLALLAWIAYTLNTVIEGIVFSSYVNDPWFNLITFTPPVLLCAGATAWLYPSHHRAESFLYAWRTHFQQRTASAWTWRLLLAAVSFMPIYYFFGLLVVPFVGAYYQQSAFGLAVPPLSTLLAVLLLRSVLFFVATLPVIVAWQGTKGQLWLRLGFALFVLVGLIYMLAGTWLPPALRFIHSLEILADSFVHAAVLVWLLAPRGMPNAVQPKPQVGHLAKV